jgi:hypothetical protein
MTTARGLVSQLFERCSFSVEEGVFIMSQFNTSAERIGNGTPDRHAARERLMSGSRDGVSERTVDLEPTPDLWKDVTAGSVVPLGLAGAAAFTSYITKHERVAVTAWIAVAVVGSAAVIAAASASRRKHIEVNRDRHHDRDTSRTQELSKEHAGGLLSPEPV